MRSAQPSRIDDNAAQAVLDFVASETRYPLRKLTLATDLMWDIGLAGDDSHEFFLAFSKKFDVEIRVDIARIFGDEGMHLYDILLLPFAIASAILFRRRRKPTVTVADLITAVGTGELTEPDRRDKIHRRH